MKDYRFSLHPFIDSAGAALFLVCLTIVIYANTFNAPFVLDDHHFVKNDPTIRMDELTWQGVKDAAFESRPKNRSLPNISFALNYYLNGFEVAGYHAVNIVLHVFAGMFLFLFIRQILRGHDHPINQGPSRAPIIIAFLSVLIWMVHPVHTQTVTYIYQRMTSMAALFFMLSLWLYARGRLSWSSHKRLTPSAGLMLFCCAASFICAIISKQNAAMLPIIILLYEWFFFQNLSVSFSRKKLLWFGGAMLVFAVIAALFLGGSPFERILNAYTRRDFTLPERVMTEWRVVIYYISLFFYPAPGRLNLDHDYPLSISLGQPMTTLPALGCLIALIALALYVARRHRLLAFCLFWFMLNLLIESSVIGIEIIFEHRTYLPYMLLPLFCISMAFRKISSKSIVIGVTCVIAVIFSVWTYQRNLTWQNAANFAWDRVHKSPHKARPNMEMGVYLAHQKKYDAAIHYLQKALQRNPNSRVMESAYSNLGNVLALTGQFEAAIVYYQKSLGMDPDDARTRENMQKVMKLMERRK